MTVANRNRRRRRSRTGSLSAGVLGLLAGVLLVIHAAGTSGGPHHFQGASPPTTTTSERLLPLRVADPGGGAPWGMRLVRTRSGLLCAQVGRVEAGELGLLGIDGAFSDDARFHPLASQPFPEVTVPGTLGENAECVAPKETFSGIIDGLDRNAIANPEGEAGTLSDRREIGFGLLGPHAISVTYEHGRRSITRPVVNGVGAFLVIRAARLRRYLGSAGAAPGSDYSDDLQPAGPTGFLEAITYRYGRTVCRDDGTNVLARCHLADHPLGAERTPSQKGD